jgi:hypothetical protein
MSARSALSRLATPTLSLLQQHQRRQLERLLMAVIHGLTRHLSRSLKAGLEVLMPLVRQVTVARVQLPEALATQYLRAGQAATVSHQHNQVVEEAAQGPLVQAVQAQAQRQAPERPSAAVQAAQASRLQTLAMLGATSAQAVPAGYPVRRQIVRAVTALPAR